MATVSAYSAFNMETAAHAAATTLDDGATTSLLEYFDAGGTYLDQFAGTFTLSSGMPTGGNVNEWYVWTRPGSEFVLDLQITGLSADLDTVLAHIADDDLSGLWEILFAGADTMFGSPAADRLLGHGGADTLSGGGGVDRLRGMAGNDTLNGQGGVDNMAGGAGNDRYIVNHASDVVTEVAGQGTDRVDTSVSYTLPANAENMVLSGAGVINGTGNGAANEMTGNAAGNVLSGLGGADTLSGEGGADTLRGGAGKDTLYGGAGADKFDFNAVSESPPGSGRDSIGDFDAQDRIDLSTIDANSGMAGNQAFTFITGTSFTGPGQVYYNNSTHILYGNTDADTAAEFQITILFDGVSSLAAADFIL